MPRVKVELETDLEITCGTCSHEQDISIHLSKDRQKLLLNCDNCNNIVMVIGVEGQFDDAVCSECGASHSTEHKH